MHKKYFYEYYQSRFPKRIYVFCLLALLISFTTPYACENDGNNTQNSFESFMLEPTYDSWESLTGDIRSGAYGTEKSLFYNVLLYNDARLLRDLPNSMSREGMTPDEFVNFQVSRLNDALKIIKDEQSNDLWRLLNNMALQNFDDDVVWSALEIAARISKDHFETIASSLNQYFPESSWIVERTRERWTMEEMGPGLD